MHLKKEVMIYAHVSPIPFLTCYYLKKRHIYISIDNTPTYLSEHLAKNPFPLWKPISIGDLTSTL